MSGAEATTVARGGSEVSGGWQVSAPVSMLAELTHRCPLQCPYCSNPLELERRAASWIPPNGAGCSSEAAELGVLQVHLSGGEPTARRDLEAIVAHARGLGLYTNLITAGVLLDEPRLAALREAGLEHVQLSRCRTPSPATPIGSAAIATGTPRSSRWPRGPRRGPAADHQCRGAPAEPRPSRGDDGAGAGAAAPSGSRWRTSNTMAGRCSTAPR